MSLLTDLRLTRLSQGSDEFADDFDILEEAIGRGWDQTTLLAVNEPDWIVSARVEALKASPGDAEVCLAYVKAKVWAPALTWHFQCFGVRGCLGVFMAPTVRVRYWITMGSTLLCLMRIAALL